jgi:hypothetical protein
MSHRLTPAVLASVLAYTLVLTACGGHSGSNAHSASNGQSGSNGRLSTQATYTGPATLTWTKPSSGPGQKIRDPSSLKLTCPSATFCVELNGGKLSAFDGHTWTPMSIPDGPKDGYSLVSVSCGSPSFCVAVGGGAGSSRGDLATVFDGKSWSTPAIIYAVNEQSMDVVSCVSSRFCMGINFENSGVNVLTFDGKVWSAPTTIDTISNNGNTFGSGKVSCASSSLCAVSDINGVMTFDGHRWSPPTAVFPQAGSNDSPSELSCVPTSFCLLAYRGVGDNIATFDGHSWSSPTAIVSQGAILDELSCVSASFCVGTTSSYATHYVADGVTIFDGHTWSAPRLIDPHTEGVGVGFGLESLSCASAGFCAVADSYGKIVTGSAP